MLTRQIDPSRNAVIAAAFAVLVVFPLALILGFIAALGNVAIVGIVAGTIGGLFLMTAPQVSIRIIILLGLGGGAIVSLAGPLASKLPWGISLMSVLLMAPALLNMLWLRKAPAHIWLAITLMIYAICVSIMHWQSLAEFLGGFKRYFQGYGLMLALALITFSVAQYKRWFFYLTVIAFMQLPFCLFELFVLVPLRGGLAAGGEASDVVAGTFSANLRGGSSGSDLFAFLTIALAFALARWREGVLSNRQAIVCALMMTAPFLTGESKIVVILLPLMFLVVYRAKILRNPMQFLPAAALVAALTFCLALLYAEVFVGSSLSEVLANTFSYNFADKGYGSNLLNRTTVLSFWWSNQSWTDPAAVLFGHGLGASYSSVGEFGGHIAAHYPRYGINLTTASTLLWDLGVIGLCLFLAMHIAVWRIAGRLIRESKIATVRADSLGIQAAVMLVFVYLNYTDSLVNLVTAEVMFAAAFGYLAVLVRQHEATTPSFPHR